MTAGNYGYGPMRATDADRENVRQLLQDAHADGRLSWDEFDSRSSALLNAQTYGQLTELTSDLANRIPGTPPQAFPPGGYGGQQFGAPQFGAPQFGAPQFGAQQFGAQQFGGQPFPSQRPNGMAIAALICGVCQIFFWFFSGIPAIVLGHLARRQIRQTGEAGNGMAMAGMILGYVGLALTVLFVIAIVALVASAPHINNLNPPTGP